MKESPASHSTNDAGLEKGARSCFLLLDISSYLDSIQQVLSNSPYSVARVGQIVRRTSSSQSLCQKFSRGLTRERHTRVALHQEWSSSLTTGSVVALAKDVCCSKGSKRTDESPLLAGVETSGVALATFTIACAEACEMLSHCYSSAR